MYRLVITKQFKKDLKKLKKRKRDFEFAVNAMKVLQQKGVKGIPLRMRPHHLRGKYTDTWECHLKPDLLIIWIQFISPKTIRLVRIGSHSDLFK